MDLGYPVTLPSGASYLQLASGQRIFIPSGGAPEGDPTPPATDPPTPPPDKISLDQIDWDKVQLDKRNLPKPFLSIVGDIVAKERKPLQSALEAARGELTAASQAQQELREQVGELQNAIEALKSPPPPDDGGEPKIPAAFSKHPDLAKVWLDLASEKKGAKEVADALKAELAETKKQLETLSSTAEQERQQRTAAQERLRNLQRDKEVLGVLSTLNVIDPRRELAFYASRAEYDANTDSFVYRNADGDLVSLAEGIKADLPEYVLRPDVRNGGSGSHGGQGGGSPRPETPQDRRARAAQELAALKSKVERKERLSPLESTKMLQLGRELKELGATA